MYYKVVTKQNKSLGLRNNPTILKYKLFTWVTSPTIKKGNSDDGGIWVTVNKSNAKTLKMYMKKKYNIDTKIYEVDIDKILYKNSYRLKTNKIKLLRLVKDMK